ncbi:MAG: TolB family protein [Candidatus Promineifilaceae bacterium]
MFLNWTKRPNRLIKSLVLLFMIALAGCGVFPDQSDDLSLLYLGWDENNEVQLFGFSSSKSQKLTDFDSGVHDFALSPDGRNLILTTLNDNGDSDLWLMRKDGSQQELIFSCPQAECANFTWVPDSRRLLFERRELDSGGISGTPFLWWLDTQTSTALPLQEDNEQHGANGRVSPDGQWISYISPEDEGLVIYNLETGASQFVINEIGADVTWNPDSTQLIVPQLDLIILHGEEGEDHQTHTHDYQTAIHLLRIDVDTGEQEIISGDLRVEDSVPAWSPDGEWIAFGRRAVGAGAPRQLWIVHPDGSGARALTDDSAINHGPPVWTADGRSLIFQQIPQGDLGSKPSIWQIDIETGEKQELVSSGMLPA